MDNVVQSINIGFAHSVFCTRNPHSIEECIKSVINEKKGVLANDPKNVKVETIDDLHDKMRLLYENETIEGTITWGISTISTEKKNRFVFLKFE